MNIPPSNHMSWQTWFSLLALGLVLWFTVTYGNVLLELSWIFFGALLLSLALRPLADHLDRWHAPRGLTVLGIYALMAGLLVGVGNLLAPVLGAEVNALRANGPALFQGTLSHLMNSPLARWIPSTDTIVQSASQRLNALLTGALGTVAGISNLTLDLTVVLILAYFFTTDRDWNGKLILSWLPFRWRRHVQAILSDVRRRLTRWLWAQVGVALYFTVTFSVGLALLGVPFALSLGVVSGLLGVVPYLGTFFAILLAVLSALTVSPLLALWAAIFTLVASSVEIHVVAPVLYGQAMGLRPDVILVALLVGAKLQGIPGIIFAVPVAVILAAVVQEVQAGLEPATAAQAQVQARQTHAHVSLDKMHQ